MAETKVINIRELPGRTIPANGDYVYIGRAGRGHDGYFGNPIAINEPCPECGRVHNRGETLVCYEEYLRRRVQTDPIFRDRVRNLKNKTLVCFCHPAPCHGHVLARVAEELNKKLSPSDSLGDNKEEKMNQKEDLRDATEETMNQTLKMGYLLKLKPEEVEEIYDCYIAPLAGAFIKGKLLNDRPATKRAMDVVKSHFLTETTFGEEGWALVKEWAVKIFKAHEEEGTTVTLYDENNNVYESDEALLNDARRRAERWYKTINKGGGGLDPLSQKYIETLEELLYLQHKFDNESGPYGPGELDRLVERIDQLEFELVHRELLVVEQFEMRAEGEKDRRRQRQRAEAYLGKLRSYVEEKVRWELEEGSTEYLFQEEYDRLEAEEPEPGETAIEALIRDEELELLAKEAKSGRYRPSYEPNWAHIWALKAEAEKAAEQFVSRLERETTIALHGKEMVEGEMRPFIFPESEQLLARYRAKVKDTAQKVDSEKEYQEKLAEMREVMIKLFRTSQRAGQEKYRVQLISRLKKELFYIRRLFLMPSDVAALRKAQKEHIVKKKPMRFFPTLCKQDYQCSLVIRKLDLKELGVKELSEKDEEQLSRLALRTKDGWLIKRKGASLMAYLSKEKLIDLHNDVVEVLLQLGVQESELPSFNGSPFLLPYEDHMKSLGRADEAERAVKARKERDERLEALRFQQSLNCTIGMPSYMNEEGNLIEGEIPDPNGRSPEQLLLAFEAHQSD